jgi:hypothetical protein
MKAEVEMKVERNRWSAGKTGHGIFGSKLPTPFPSIIGSRKTDHIGPV